ncbi:hypothetical protein ACWER9_10325 [Micromonospora sp. NPDC003944]
MKLNRMAWLFIATAALFAFAVVLCIAAWAVANAPESGPERPKVTDWMQAWGSIAGVFAGLAAAGAATALLLHERGEARQARAELASERAEAALIAPRAVIVTAARFGTVNGKIHNAACTVHNYGSGLIRWANAHIQLPGGQVLILPPAELIPPGQHQIFSESYQTPIEVSAESWSPEGGLAPVTLRFIDSAGQRWEKTDDGQPQRGWSP